MENSLKQRLLGAVIIIGLAIIFLPVILDRDEDTRLAVTMKIPPRPEIVKNVDIDKVLDKEKAEFDKQLVNVPETLAIDAEQISQKKPSEIKQQTKEALATPAPKAQKIPNTVASKDIWVVQLGSFSKKENAQKLKQRLSKDYKKLYIENVNIPGGSTYRLRLGSFTDKNAAIRQRRNIKTKYGISGVVMAKE